MSLNRYYKGPISDHFDGKKFFFPYKPFTHKFIDFLKWQINEKRPYWPLNVPIKQNKPKERCFDELCITCIGHASLLIQGGGLNILTDPQFSLRASPFQWFGPKRHKAPGIDINDLPPIDLIFISHNHYDHLDIPSLRKICQSSPLIITPLGNEKIILKEIPHARIKTLDWGDVFEYSSRLTLQLYPSQHWSARGIFDRNFALWGSVTLKLDEKLIFFMGDSGYDRKFFEKLKEMINAKPFLSILPIGSCEPKWFMNNAHMGPEDAFEVFKIFESNYLLPIHYDVFALGNEAFGSLLPHLKQIAGHQKEQILGLEPGEHINLHAI